MPCTATVGALDVESAIIDSSYLYGDGAVEVLCILMIVVALEALNASVIPVISATIVATLMLRDLGIDHACVTVRTVLLRHRLSLVVMVVMAALGQSPTSQQDEGYFVNEQVGNEQGHADLATSLPPLVFLVVATH